MRLNINEDEVRQAVTFWLKARYGIDVDPKALEEHDGKTGYDVIDVTLPDQTTKSTITVSTDGSHGK